MALFNRGSGKPAGGGPLPLPAKQAHCYVCGAQRSFTRSWHRKDPVRECPGCGFAPENLGAVYAQLQPRCPRCEEPFEQPGFDYGFCDACGSKFELMDGAKPGLLPNAQQRQEMARHQRGDSSPA